jgi:type IV pilus assembly protein PilC
MNWERGFLRNLYQTVSAGISFYESLELLRSREVDLERQQQLETVVKGLHQGRSLSSSLRQAGCLSDFEQAMIKTGEGSGALMKVLAFLADHRERTSRVEQEIKSSLVQPTLTLAFCLVGCIVLLPYLMKGQLELLKSLDTDLPLISRALVAVSVAMGSPLFWIGAAVVGGAIVWSLRFTRDKPRLRLIRDKMILSSVFGGYYRDIAAARFARPFSIGLAAGLPLEENLRLCVSASGSAVLAERGQGLLDAILSGETIAKSLAATDLFHPTFLALVAVGEESGSLPAMAMKATEMVEFELSESLSRFTTLIQPFAMMLMGGIVGFFALGILMPTVKVLEHL